MSSEAEKVHPAKTVATTVDTSGAARGVWLVKVPKYLSEKWMTVEQKTEVGKLRISKPKFTGGKPEVIFTLDDLLNPADAHGDTAMPKDHKFIMTGVGSQFLAVLGEGPGDRVAVEGKVMQRAECRPIGDKSYMNLKRIHIEKTNQPKREIVHLDKAVLNYRPVMDHDVNIEFKKRKKEEGKRSRADKDQVTEMLFAAFEKHQYYNVRDLELITKQPVPYLKEILREFCTYNTKAPHRNMWELKPEYRHYKEAEAST